MKESKEQRKLEKQIMSLLKNYENEVEKRLKDKTVLENDMPTNKLLQKELTNENIENFLQHFDMIKINSQMFKRYEKDYLETKFFHKSGFVLSTYNYLESEEYPNNITSLKINFLGYNKKKDKSVQGSGGAFADSMGDNVQEKKITLNNNLNRMGLVRLLDDIVSKTFLCNKPESGFEFFYLSRLDLLKSIDDLKNIKKQPAIMEYIAPAIPDDIVNYFDLEKEKNMSKYSEKMVLENIISGKDNPFTVCELSQESIGGFLDNIANEISTNKKSCSNKDKRKKEFFNKELLSEEEKEFFELCIDLIFKRKNVNDIDKKWFDYQAFGTMNLLNCIGKITKKDLDYIDLFKDIIDRTEKIYGQETLRQNLLYIQYNCINATPFEKIFNWVEEYKENTEAIEKLDFIVHKILDVIKSEDFYYQVPETFQKDSDKTQYLFESISYNISHIFEYIDSAEHKQLPQMSLFNNVLEKIGIILSHMEEDKTIDLLNSFDSRLKEIFLKEYKKQCVKKESDDIKQNINNINKHSKKRKVAL